MLLIILLSLMQLLAQIMPQSLDANLALEKSLWRPSLSNNPTSTKKALVDSQDQHVFLSI